MQIHSEWQIRKGCLDDLNQVMDLIKELAKFEHASEQVINTAQSLTDDWKAGWFELLIASDLQEQVIGMALYHKAYSTWKGKMLYLDDLVVKEPYRGRGIGGALLLALQKEAHNCGASLIKWQVLDWNKNAISLYQKLGATIEKDWWNCKWSTSIGD
jgi:GNAT superfamily N-acetyltransferase